MELGHETLERLVDRLVTGEIVLPDIQRDYVWSGSQIPRFLDSLNQEWPIGSVLLWQTSLNVPIKTAGVTQGAAVGVRPSILLDGQQRLTTMARVMHPDTVPAGQKQTDVRYNPELKEFRNVNAVQQRDKTWIPVSSILRNGAQYRQLLRPLGLAPDVEDAWTDDISGVARRILNFMIPVQTVSEDAYERVAEIFNRVNTGGTRLSKGDLVIGSMAARWPGGRHAVESFEAKLADLGWKVSREVLLRIMSVLAVKSPNHIRLLSLSSEVDWARGWADTEACVLDAVNYLQGHARIPNHSLLPTEYVLLPIAIFLHDRKGAFGEFEADRLARWVYLASAFGHYSGSLETRLSADIEALRSEEPIAALIRLAQEPRTPGVRLTTSDLFGRTKNSPFLRLLELRAVQLAAPTWLSNRAIAGDPTLRVHSVEVHHIFPKNWMRKRGLEQHAELDTIANFAFLSKRDNIRIGDEDPALYLARLSKDALHTQWIPEDTSLWACDRFTEFCSERRVLLVQALNEMLGLTMDPHTEEPIGDEEGSTLAASLAE